MSLEKLLREKGMTKYQLSKMSGIPKTTISDLCSRKSDIEKCSVRTVKKLADTLNISIERLLSIIEISAYDCQKGKPIDKSYLEINLPGFIKKDIDAYLEGEKNKVLYLDCLWSELYGSINSALHSAQISEEQAQYLRGKYLFEEEEEYD